MDFRTLKEFNNHELVIGFTDETVGLRGYIAIHTTEPGPALGGTRFQIYQSETAALKDVLNLSRAMSYKCALAGLRWGGGKAVIMDEKGLNRNDALRSYAKAVENLRGLFKTGTDVGVGDDDVMKMSKHTQHMLGVSPADRGDMTTSKTAALGVYYAIKEACAHAYGIDDLRGRRVGIKGVGKLGGELARLLHQDGVSLVVADTVKRRTEELVQQFSDIEVVESGNIHKQPLDVFAPCALGGDISNKTIGELQTLVIAGGANNQLASESLGELLFQRGILHVPDYIANAGGLIYVADELEEDGFQQARVLQRVSNIGPTLRDIFTQSKKLGLPPDHVADTIAQQRIAQAGLAHR